MQDEGQEGRRELNLWGEGNSKENMLYVHWI